MGISAQFVVEGQRLDLVSMDQRMFNKRDGLEAELESLSCVRANSLSERLGSMICPGSYSTLLILKDVRFADDVLIDLQAKVSCNFEPDRCNRQIATFLTRGGAEAVERLLQVCGEQAIRRVFKAIASSQLRSDKMWGKIEREIYRQLDRNLLPYGLTVPQANY